ncbi:MAG: dockerin type I repeat-containing protein [Planctomycetales bacterium]|nr:dockerin type I repeat-containing protein [Planctomycetales bacterium]
MGTWFGDANLDGEFNSTDLVVVFQAGVYEDSVLLNAGWSTGDWNGDGEFNSSDLVTAFQTGGYGQGPRDAVAASAVPEPSTCVALGLGISCAITAMRRRLVNRASR